MKKGWGYFFVLIFLALGCDTASTFDPPEEGFFVKFYGDEGNQEGVDAVINPDGTITLFGTTEELNKGKQLYLVNILPNGLINWEQKYGTDKNEIAKDIELTRDGRLAIVADIENTPTEHDILVMTLGLDGAVIASDTIKFMNGGIPTDETANSITQISDGFIVAGSSSNIDLKPTGTGPGAGVDTRDAIHIRLFDDLTVYPNTWRQGYGPGTYDEATKVIEVSANQFYSFGNSDIKNAGDLDFYVLGLSPVGEGNNTNDFLPGQPGSNETLSSVAFSPIQSGEGFLLAGISQTPGASADIYIVKLRKDLSFNSKEDVQFQKPLSINLGIGSQAKVSAVASSGSGFLLLANEKLTGIQNFCLTKIDNSGFPVWSDPVIFGGELDDRIGAVLELPDGSIGIIGTFSIGKDGETKMTFIKVNKEGKFSK